MRGFRSVAAPAAICSGASPSRPFQNRLTSLERSHCYNEHSRSKGSLTPLSTFRRSTSIILQKKKSVLSTPLIDNLYRLSRLAKQNNLFAKARSC
jgi:hypothetical protein